MGILDRLYIPTAKDIGSGNSNVRRWWKAFNASGVTATPTTSDTELGPTDTVRLIHTVTFNWVPGAAQSPISASLGVVQPGAANPFQLVGTQPPFTTVGVFNSYATIAGVDLLWMQGEFLQLTGYFNAGANSNAIGVLLSGLEFPRGSIQR